MNRRRKPVEDDPPCPDCGCPESSTFMRMTLDRGVLSYTACNGCGKLVQPVAAARAPAPAAAAGPDLLALARMRAPRGKGGL